MHTCVTLLIFSLVTQLAYHATDAIITAKCPNACHCENEYSQCRQLNLTYIPQRLPHLTISLDISNNRIFSLQNGSFQSVPNLEILQVYSNRISHIESASLSNLPNLRILILRDNRISSIPTNLFSVNRNLKIVDLSHNALYYLPHESINHLFNLQVLNVSHNHISSAYLDHNFRDTPHIQHLDLSFNYIQKIENENFESVSWWETDKPHHLNLSNCKIRNIQRQAFKDLRPLSSLTLSDNPQLSIHSLTTAMRDIPADNLQTLNLANLSISGLGNMFKDSKFRLLLNLDLSRNYLEQILAGALYTLQDLRVLDLSCNFISDIQNFNGLNNLEILNLNQNQLERIDFSLDELQTLRKLYLSANRLTNINGQTFENLWDLELLDVSHNHLSNINIKFGLENIRLLYLDHNNLTDISFLQSLPHVEIFHASFNRIEFLSTSMFSRAQMIRTLNISHNRISHIEPNTFALSTLIRLDLSHNKLDQLLHFGWKSPLTELYFDHNNITYIAPNSLQGLQTLQVLDMSHCGLYGFSLQTFQDLTLLTTLDISHNNLGRQFLSTPKAQSVFQSMTNLQNLDASFCKLTEFPNSLATARETLKHINLCCNEISKLSKDDLNGFLVLDTLNLANNQISSIDIDIFSDLILLENIDMSHNPFSCSCDLKPLCDWFNSLEVNKENFQSPNSAYSCQTSEGDTLQISQFCSTTIPHQCDEHVNMILWIVLASVIVITFLITLVLVYKYCHKKRQQKLKRRENQNIALQNSCKGENEKMMPDTCRYICDDMFKEDML